LWPLLGFTTLLTLVKIFRLKRKPGSYKYREFNIKIEQRTSVYIYIRIYIYICMCVCVCVYNTHIRAGVGNDMLQISEMVDFEGT